MCFIMIAIKQLAKKLPSLGMGDVMTIIAIVPAIPAIKLRRAVVQPLSRALLIAIKMEPAKGEPMNEAIPTPSGEKSEY